MNTMEVRQRGSVTVVLLIVMTVAFLSASTFALWAFVGKQESESDLDAKITAATEAAVDKAEADKEAEFTEREKQPFRTYTGSPTYGSLSFGFPKDWNVYAVSKSGTLLDFYANPNLIPGLGSDTNFAFRAQILDSSYSSEVEEFENAIEDGDVTATAYRAGKVPTQLGVFLRGAVVKGKSGVMVLLPQRDKTFKFWTEADLYIDDFNAIMETVSFIP